MAHDCHNVAQLFERMVGQFSDKAALAFGDGKVVSYRELNDISHRAAAFLTSRGLRKGDRIAICMEKCVAAYALLLASLKLGLIYVALDPRNPPARREAILNQCSPNLIVLDAEAEGTVGYPAVVLPHKRQDGVELFESFSASPPRSEYPATGSDAAYVMFTSGSTGTPKGAVIGHDNLLHFIGWTWAEYGFRPEDIHTHLNPIYFDNSVFDIYSTFFSGGSLVPFDIETVQDPSLLFARLRKTRCTVWFSVPSLLMFLQVMKVANRANLGGLKKLIFGGEGFPKAKLKHLFDEIGSGTELHNVYGPTECTCICSSYQISAADFDDMEGLPPLGALAGHFNQYLLDGGKPVATGEPGELYLGGACVGLGYYKSPDLTAAAFVQNPMNDGYREILYRTGDLVCVHPKDGKLRFLGRRDLQVKHMGYRIELEEIQHAIMKMDGVDEAAVLHLQSGDVSELIAVVATKHSLSAAQLKAALSRRVPKYMMPSKFHLIEQMPKNANGKTDRTALKQRYLA